MHPALPDSLPPICELHHGLSWVHCVRCGAFLCDRCPWREFDGNAHCINCVVYVRKHGRPSRTLWAALALEAVALLGLPAAWLSLEQEHWPTRILRITLLLFRLPVLPGLAALVGLGVAALEWRRKLLSPAGRRWTLTVLFLACLCLLCTVLAIADLSTFIRWGKG